jgi:hypothetical protein
LPIKPNHEQSWDGKPRVLNARDSRVAEVESKEPDYRGFIQNGNPVFILRNITYERAHQKSIVKNPKRKEVEVNTKAVRILKR